MAGVYNKQPENADPDTVATDVHQKCPESSQNVLSCIATPSTATKKGKKEDWTLPDDNAFGTSGLEYVTEGMGHYNWFGRFGIDSCAKDDKKCRATCLFMLATKGDVGYVMLRGTAAALDNISDLVVDIAGGVAAGETVDYPARMNTNGKGKPMYVYKSFAKMARDQFAQIKDKIKGWITAASPVKTILFVGHSLGGAMAQLNAFLTFKEFRMGILAKKIKLEVFTIGSPRVGNKAFQKFFDNSANIDHTRVTNTGDFVPKVRAFSSAVGNNELCSGRAAASTTALFGPPQIVRFSENGRYVRLG